MTTETLKAKEMFYVASIKWTKRTDPYITFWRPDDRGYAYPLSWAGKYSRDEIKQDYHNDGVDTVAIHCYAVDEIAVAPEKGLIDNDAGPVVLNNKDNWKFLLSWLIERPTSKPRPQFKGARRAA